ncbi:MAG: hypothetical protein GX941_07035 [Candidatus Methanofastidiosa archaeon]|jgi:hypothetical protein|nr:hypothetical protein [Candidatus Methanofastidiosa archaeon]HOM95644.1 hypothetical protein [Methanofastidiosum sp.]HRS24971.1 hypothetical protein [Methanofastidiosum sp.]
MSDIQVFEVLAKILPYLVSLGIGTFAGWELVKTKIHELAEFFNVVDEALYDDAVTEKEFRAIWEKGRALFQWNFTAKKGEA